MNIKSLYVMYLKLSNIIINKSTLFNHSLFIDKKVLNNIYKIPSTYLFFNKYILTKMSKLPIKFNRKFYYNVKLKFKKYLLYSNNNYLKLNIFLVRQYIYNKIKKKKYKFINQDILSFKVYKRIKFFKKLNFSFKKKKIRIKKFNFKELRRKERGRMYTHNNFYILTRKYTALYWAINCSNNIMLDMPLAKKKYKFFHLNTVRKYKKYKNRLKKFNYKYFSLKNILKYFLSVKKLQMRAKMYKSINFLKFYYTNINAKKKKSYRSLSLIQKSFITKTSFNKKIHLFFYKEKKPFLYKPINTMYLSYKNSLFYNKIKKHTKIYFCNFNESILRKIRDSRRAQWSYYFNSRLNTRKYKIFFNTIGKTSYKLWFFEVLSFFIVQIYNKFFCWNHISLLLKIKIFLINFKNPSKTKLLRHGDIISLPYSMVNGIISIWYKFNANKFLRRIKRWSYLNYCKYINKKLLKKKKFPKIFKKLPISIYIYRKNLILDYLIPTAVFLHYTNSYKFNLSSQWEISTVYKLYAWKFVS